MVLCIKCRFSYQKYTSNLLRLLPKSGKDIVDIDDKVRLEYANLKETHTGAIILDEKKVVWVPGGATAPKKPNKKKDTLQSIIDKVNERFDGQFTDADKVIIEGIYRMFMDDKDVKKFKKYASDNSTEMFVNSLFPEKFKEIVYADPKTATARTCNRTVPLSEPHARGR